MERTAIDHGERFSIKGKWTAGVPDKYFEGTAMREATGEAKLIEGVFRQKSMKKDRRATQEDDFEALIRKTFFGEE